MLFKYTAKSCSTGRADSASLERLVARNGVTDTDAYGMNVKNTGDRIMQNLVFRNMVFKDVFAVQPILDPDDFNSIQVAGLSFFSSKNTIAGNEKHIRDVLVVDYKLFHKAHSLFGLITVLLFDMGEHVF